MQLQDDRLIHNWRQQEGRYPRFETLRDQFKEVLRSFRSTLAKSKLPEPLLRQVEVTYINWIASSSPAEFLRPGADSTITVDGVDPKPVSELWNASYHVRAGNSILGRLSVESKPTARPTDQGITGGHLLSLTYLAPLADGLSDRDVDIHLLGLSSLTLPLSNDRLTRPPSEFQ